MSRITPHLSAELPLRGSDGDAHGGFTLIELMVVVAIMAIVMTMSVPVIYKVLHREPLNKAVRDVVEVLSNARARSIMQGRVVEVYFHPRTGLIEIAGAGPSHVHHAQTEGVGLAQAQPPSNSGLSAQLSDKLEIEMLDVNLTEYKDKDLARVRFFPNGTCDEMTLVLHALDAKSENEEWAGISLEITTGLASVVTDRNKLKMLQ
jgi:type II secretion system protein H